MERAGAAGSGCFFRSSIGWLRLGFTPAGLSEMVFDDDPPVDCPVDPDFRAAFLQWLAGFERLDAGGRWRCLDPAGTEFQKSVWRALLEIPYGGRSSYGRIAAELGRPKASRAVGSAVGANPIAWLLPCHRVLPRSGEVGHYRWGAERKRALLEAESKPGSDLPGLLSGQR